MRLRANSSAGAGWRWFIKVLDLDTVTPLEGMRYLVPADDMVLEARDGKVRLPCGDVPLPLLVEDFDKLEGNTPDYDMVGRGLYQALRLNPDCVHGARYAAMLRDAYPHYISDIATNLLMLEHKEVDTPYLERQITLLRIFALLEPENPHFPLQVGLTLMEKGLRMAGLQTVTTTLYRAVDYLTTARNLAADDPTVLYHSGELAYLLGRYAEAGDHWRRVLAHPTAKVSTGLAERLARLEQGTLPLVPVVDYLQAIGIALEQAEAGEHAEAAAIIQDILDDEAFCRDYLTAEIYVVLARCYQELAMPKFAQEYYQAALRLDPVCGMAQQGLQAVGGGR